jgi:hypothetical protein
MPSPLTLIFRRSDSREITETHVTSEPVPHVVGSATNGTGARVKRFRPS